MRATRLTMFAGLVVALAVARAGEGLNRVQNGDFAKAAAGETPDGWSTPDGQKLTTDTSDKPQDQARSLRVEIVKDGGGSLGQLYQKIKIRPETIYRVEGWIKSSKAELALLSVKLMKGRQETKRLAFGKSAAQWSRVTEDVASGEADELQILCRWNQNAQRGGVGQTVWFAGISVTEKGPAPPPPAWVAAAKQAAQVQAVAPSALPLKPTDADFFVTPSGAGARDGTSWENALPGNAPGVLQAAWDALTPGHACRVGSGVYAKAELTVETGGTAADKMKRLVGEDTGGGPAWFVGDWNPDAPDKGKTFIMLAKEADFCAFENLRIVRYKIAVYSSKGRHEGLHFKGFNVYEARAGIYLRGFATENDADAASHDMLIQDCEFIHFTKSAIRLEAGNYDVRVVNCVADAGGVEWMKESFQVCYNLRGDYGDEKSGEKPLASEHDIIFVNCVARNAIWSKDRYWQGDGFLAEGGVRNLAYINCESYDHADGGWDVKASNVVYVNCIGMRSKKNVRMWKHGFLYNCLSAYAYKHGGSWSASGGWTRGDVKAYRCTFHNNDSQQISIEKEAKVQLEKCIVSSDGTGGLYDNEALVTKTETAEWRAKTDKEAAVGDDPEFVAAASNKAWLGQPADAFDSKRHGEAKGFNSGMRAAWRKKTGDELIAAARSLLGHQGWEDFKKRVEAVK